MRPGRNDVDVIATDLDGTLFSSERRVADRTVAALRAASEAGLTIIAATGRSQWTAVPRLRPAGVIRWAVCSNGSAIYDLETDSIVERSLLSREAAGAIVDLPRQLPGTGLAWELADGIHHDPTFIETREVLGLGAYRQEPREELLVTTDVNKVMVGHAELAHDELLAAVWPLLPTELSITSAGISFIEITAPGVHKGATLDRLTDRLKLDAGRSMAFGDQQNDLEMIRWAQYGYAMANAHPTVLAATELRAPHHDDYGVARVIETVLTH